MSQYGARKDPPWSQLGVGVSGAAAGLSQTLLQQQNPSLLGAQPGVGATPTTNIYGQSLVASAGLGGASTTTAYPLQAQTLQQRQTLALQQQQAAAAQNAAAVAAAAGAGAPQLTVSYPTTRGTQGGPPRQRVFTGTVTKLHDTFGFVDEDVFFQTNTVKGSMPKIGDRVLVEATYNASMPFKWNATRIQMLNNQMSEQTVAQQQQQQQLKMHQLKQMPTNQRIEQNITQQFKMLKQSQQPLLKAPQQQAGGLLSSQPQPQGLLSTPPPLLQQPPAAVVQQPALIQQGAQSIQNLAGAYAQANRAGQLSQQAVGRREFGGSSRDRDRDRERERERERAQREREREREREQRERERERERERRERERQRERERSPVRRRSRSPRRSPRRTKRVVQRYMVQIPRFALDIPNADVIELHKRYMSMYIPSDFFMANFSWQDVFPIHRPMNVAQPCTFHIMHKDVPPLGGATSVLDPPDADYFYSAKVMLMASVSQDELYERCCARPQDPSEVRENFQHPTRLINFLVGQKGKNEVMAIGGPWSPSLDGEDPVNDSSVLIKTAIRTTKALTGIDLSSCTQWYRFLELCYHRPEENHKGRVIPARVETVVIFVPDVWHILPTKVEWESVRDDYKKALNSRLSPGDKEPPEGDMSQEDAGDEAEVEKQVPTSWKELDPKNMKVNELRQELDSRGLNSKGLKSQLIARLTKALKTEQESEDAEAEAMEMEGGGEDGPGGNTDETSTPTKVPEEKEKDEEEDKKEEKKEEKKDDEKKKELGDEEKRRRDEREKRDLEQRYQLPESPAIVVHPSATAKNGKFDCVLTSLSVLLDYRVEDNKEHSFEVSLFAELFNEMMQRDFAFNIFKALYKAPEKKEEKKEKDDKKKDKDKKDEKDKKEDRDEPKNKKRKTEDKDGDRDADRDRDKDEDRSERKEDDSKDEDRDGEEEDNEGRSADEEEEDDDRRKDDKRSDDEKRKSRRVKTDTLDSALLLSCVYFDQNHCGYILERDLEEILYTIGLHLSRAQVRKLLQKVVTRDSWNYRKFTDGPKKEKDEVTKMETNGVPSDEELGKGNHFLKESMIDAKKMKRGSSLDGPNMVSYGGSVVDIANLLNQVHKADQERLMAQKKIEQLEKQIDVLKNKASSTEATVSNVSGELHDVQKRLVSSERALSVSNSRSKKLMDVVGSAQKSLDEVMLKFNEVLEESLAAVKTEKVKEEKVKIKTEIKEEK